MKTYAEMTAELEQLAAHNERLVSGLRSAREQIVALKSDLERVGDPPNSYATFLRRCEGTTIDVLHHGRRLRVSTSAILDLEALSPGTELRLNEALAAVEAVPPSAEELRTLVRDRLGAAAVPREVRILPPGAASAAPSGPDGEGPAPSGEGPSAPWGPGGPMDVPLSSPGR